MNFGHPAPFGWVLVLWAKIWGALFGRSLGKHKPNPNRQTAPAQANRTEVGGQKPAVPL